MRVTDAVRRCSISRCAQRIREWNSPPEVDAEPDAPETGFFWAQFGKWCGAEATTMERVFSRVERKYGSMDAYLDSIGFDADARKGLQAALTCQP